MIPAETPNQAVERTELQMVLEALAHLRFRTHRYIATCPMCFQIEKILTDNNLAGGDQRDMLPP